VFFVNYSIPQRWKGVVFFSPIGCCCLFLISLYYKELADFLYGFRINYGAITTASPGPGPSGTFEGAENWSQAQWQTMYTEWAMAAVTDIPGVVAY
jgi:hypothetical protein